MATTSVTRTTLAGGLERLAVSWLADHTGGDETTTAIDVPIPCTMVAFRANASSAGGATSVDFAILTAAAGSVQDPSDAVATGLSGSTAELISSGDPILFTRSPIYIRADLNAQTAQIEVELELVPGVLT